VRLVCGKGAPESFQQCRFEASARFGWRVHAFVARRNHFHLALEIPGPNLSDGMKWLQGTRAARFNRFRAETGRLFQGRDKALQVADAHALAQGVTPAKIAPSGSGRDKDAKTLFGF